MIKKFIVFAVLLTLTSITFAGNSPRHHFDLVKDAEFFFNWGNARFKVEPYFYRGEGKFRMVKVFMRVAGSTEWESMIHTMEPFEIGKRWDAMKKGRKVYLSITKLWGKEEINGHNYYSKVRVSLIAWIESKRQVR
ncbi:MAG: hypothetical protein JXA20_17515 [Spirochaetes bacterium]|nr:hypothetical protein [Spirochaetota bacterium]